MGVESWGEGCGMSRGGGKWLGRTGKCLGGGKCVGFGKSIWSWKCSVFSGWKVF